MKSIIGLLLSLSITAVASADYLECKNAKEQSTDIGFYNNYGTISYQLSAPYKTDYLYLIGICDSEHGVGLPYKCEVDSNVIEVNLIRGEKGIPTAEIKTIYDNGTSSVEQIACEHFE